MWVGREEEKEVLCLDFSTTVRLQGMGDLFDYQPNNEQHYSNTSNYCCYSVGRGQHENENAEGAERSSPGKACRSLVTLCSEKGFNQQ